MARKSNPSLMIWVLLLCVSLGSPLSVAVDTISRNITLSGNRTILSKGDVFELGFFRPGNSSNCYLGIWYSLNKVSTQTEVWVANRDNPLSDPDSAELKISNGNLVLLNESKFVIWSTNLSYTAAAGDSVRAVLRDEGNLVLLDVSKTPPETLWQSFDHPTHTWLPGGRIGLNKRTKQNQLLTSWKSSNDPATGLFSLQLDPNGTNQYIIQWKKSVRYWSSGPWNGHIFSWVPEMRLNYIYNFNYVNNANESYFTYSLYNPSIISRFVMHTSGQIQQLSWLDSTKQWNLFWNQPRRQCEVYALCGAFGSCSEKGLPFCSCLKGFRPKSEGYTDLNDYSGGCLRETNLQCEYTNSSRLRGSEPDRFFQYTNMRLPDHANSVEASSAAECQSTCLSNCSCTAYSYDADVCSIWTGELLNLQQYNADESGGKTLYLRLAASELPDSKDNKGTIIGATVGSVAAASLLLGLIVFILWRRRGKTLAEGSLTAFAYRDLQNATKNFSEKLGGGGFGSVFKGTLPDSTAIAVKKLESISQGEKQFRTEVSTIGTIQHVNLVRLRGFCSEGARRLLVYEYMPNGSLDAHLFHDKSSRALDWKIRYQVALGTARGLAYLHEKCRDCIIHCDIKPENILLDSEFCPKVADFGLAKLVGRDFSRVLTTLRGTRGYLAPEWISGVAITAKADVYSYGMMLFEIVSGRRNAEQSGEGRVRFFPNQAANLLEEGGDLFTLLDPRLEGCADAGELTKMTRVALWCIQDDENNRPSMGQVVQILEGVLDVKEPPIPRSIQLFHDGQEHIVFFTESSSASSHNSQARSNASASSQAKSTSSSSAANSQP